MLTWLTRGKLVVFAVLAVLVIGFTGVRYANIGKVFGDPGYYVVIQQHPTEPRFGIGTDVTPGSASHLSIAAGVPPHLQVPPNLVWGRSAAHMAGITRRRPVRLAIHASQFL